MVVRGTVGLVALLASAACGSRTGLEVPDAGGPTVPELPPLVDGGPRILLHCPEAADDPRLPVLYPGHPGRIDARPFAEVPIASWRWSVENQGCDAVLPTPRYLLENTSDPVVSFTPARPGAYTLRLDIVATDGQTESCAFQVWAAGYGIAVELCWDTSTSTDLDLYLHRPDDASDWYAPGSYDPLSGIDSTTCNGVNCCAEVRYGESRVDWGYADWTLDHCAATYWQGFIDLGRCPNPRSSDDNNQVIASGTAEFIELDNPRHGETFRVMVQNFDNGAATPHVAVYCGGILTHEVPAPAAWPGFTAPYSGGFGLMWRPTEVTTWVNAYGVTTGCDARDVGTVTVDDPSY